MRRVFIVCVAAAVLMGATPLVGNAQTAPKRIGGHPNLNGLWQSMSTAYWNLEGHAASPLNDFWRLGSIAAIPAGQSVVKEGKIPYKPEALAQRQKNFDARATADPSLKCYQAGVPRATYVPSPLQILQGPGGTLAIVYQENHAFRVFYPDTRPHFDAADFWMGDTRYRWEGDTLVADVVALTDQMWIDGAGNFHSPDVRVVERYRMTDADTIEYEARIEDETVYSKPWTLKTVLERVKRRDARIIEDECLEGEDGVRYHISPSDPRNLLKADYSRWMNAPKQ